MLLGQLFRFRARVVGATQPAHGIGTLPSPSPTDVAVDIAVHCNRAFLLELRSPSLGYQLG